MSSTNNNQLLESIASLEKELNRLKAHLGVSGDAPAPVKEKKKRAVNPDAKPNPWIEFLKRVQSATKGKVEGAPATMGVLFAKSLKDGQENAYELEESAIADAFAAWATPENIEHAKSLKKEKKAKADAASESGSVAGSEGAEVPKADKPKRVLSEEQKAKMKAGREAAKAAKEAAKVAEAEKAPAAEAAPEKKEAAPAKPKFAKKEVKKAEYTIQQLQDWNTLSFEGEEFGVNIRGDVIDGDGNFAGHWNGSELKRDAPKPADWDLFA